MSASSSESQEESSSSQQFTKGNKLMRKSKSLRINPSNEELKYRNKNYKNVDLLAEHADKLKCTKCNINFKSDVEEGKEIFCHPLLKVLMCKNCCNYYGNGDFSLDEDDEDKYCRWCGDGGTLFLCSKCICGFCPKCIKKHFGKEKRQEIENDDDWICFFCNPEMLYDLRAICALAIKESNKNKKKTKSKRESKLMNMSKRVSTGAKTRGEKRAVESSPPSSPGKESKEAPVEEVTLGDSSSDEKSKKKEPKRVLKRKRASVAPVEATASTSGTDSDKQEPKKTKVSTPKAKTPKRKAPPVDDSSSDSDEEDTASSSSAKPLPKNLSKSVQKLRDFFKVTEMTAELCVNVCRKKLSKMEKANFITTSEKLIKESQKLTTIVTLLTTNLTAVSQSVNSLQNKLGLDETNEDDTENVNTEKSKLSRVIEGLKTCNELLAEEFASESQPDVKESENKGRKSKRKKKDDGNDGDDGNDDEKDKSDDSETDIEKCNVTKDDSVKLGNVKVRLTRLNLDKDCDLKKVGNDDDDGKSSSKKDGSDDGDGSDKGTHDDVYDVETDVGESDKEKNDEGDKEKKDENDEEKKDESSDEELVKKKVLDSSDEDLKSKKEAIKKKKKKKAIVDSDDSDGNKEERSSGDEWNGSDTSDAFIKKKNKPKTSRRSESENSESGEKPKFRRIRNTKIDTESSSESDYEEGRKNSRKKRKKKGDDDDDDTKDSPTKGRKNIKRIMKKEKLHVETKQAGKNEEERKRRLKEREKLYKELFPEKLDEDGRHKQLVLDFDPETKEPTVTVHKKLVKNLKPHQVEGVKFMWDNCFESVKRLEEDSGSGCILAHCMGLGKTLQVVTLVHTIMTHDLGVNTVLVVCPLNTVSNWLNEFEMWLANVHTDPITLFDIIRKKDYERAWQMENWQREGGVMIISYDMFRNLTKEKKLKNKKMKKQQEVYDKALLDPGPDLVICDEGHLLKNEDTALSKCMRRITTARRIVLTGTPLQNNLIEYHCMVQFIKPNILGTKKEFLNRFVNPINNGQFEDSTEWDVKVMKRRSHVLHTMLDGCVQRFDYSVLTPFLPKKYEYVISITLSETQMKLYKIYLEKFSARGDSGAGKGAKLFTDYHHLQRIWTHPHTLLAHDEKMEMRKLLADESESEGSLKDFVVSDDEDIENTPSEDSDHSVESVKNQRKRLTRSNANDPEIVKELEEVQKTQEKKWWDDYVTEQDYEDLRASYKLVLLFEILKECRKIGDKVLVFSQSLYSLDLIEYFLEKVHVASSSKPDELVDGHSGSWILGRDYFRLDGSTSSEKRTIWTNYFNKEKNKDARLFLISTRAGGLGINLTAANRVIIFDASWNPSHDVQSIFRVYRFGQKKTCYIYRFLAEATMEEKIYERQVTKLSLAHRVVDEHQIERHYTMNTLMELYTYEPIPPENRKTPMVPKDTLFADILKKHKDIIVGYHEHDSLLENKQEEELSEEERKAAWEDFEKERTARPTINYDNNLTLEQQQQQRLAFAQLMQMQSNSNFQLQNMNMNNINFINNPNMINNPFIRIPVQQNDGQIIRLPYRPPQPRVQVQQPRLQMQQPILTIDPSKLVNPFHDSDSIPNNLLQRGLLVQVTPFAGETSTSYFNRVRQKETELINQRQAFTMQQVQNLQKTLGQSNDNNKGG